MGTRHGDHWARQGPGHRHWAGMGAIAYGLLLGPSRKHSSQGGIKIPRWGLSRAIHKVPLLSKCWDIMFCPVRFSLHIASGNSDVSSSMLLPDHKSRWERNVFLF